MQKASSLPPNKNEIEASVTLHRLVDVVFGFYRDFTNRPDFLGDVEAIEQIGSATYRWTLLGPIGVRANWTVQVTELRTNEFDPVRHSL